MQNTPLSTHTCKTWLLSLDHTLSLSLSLSLRMTHTMYTICIIIYVYTMYRVWVSIILRAFSRMSMILILAFEYDTNDSYG